MSLIFIFSTYYPRFKEILCIWSVPRKSLIALINFSFSIRSSFSQSELLTRINTVFSFHSSGKIFSFPLMPYHSTTTFSKAKNTVLSSKTLPWTERVAVLATRSLNARISNHSISTDGSLSVKASKYLLFPNRHHNIQISHFFIFPIDFTQYHWGRSIIRMENDIFTFQSA